MYYFYILQSLKNGKLYLGYCSDLKRRYRQHNSGTELATKPNIPYQLIHYQAFKAKNDALECEKYFKTTAGWRRLKQMLTDSLIS
jgi:putative endonuclease